MNSSIQKFDIGFSLQQKLEELVEVRGMSHEAAINLITQAIQEWQASQRPADRREMSSGKMKAYVNLMTHHISREAQRQPQDYECEFEDVTAAAIYVADLERPMLERMRATGFGDR